MTLATQRKGKKGTRKKKGKRSEYRLASLFLTSRLDCPSGVADRLGILESGPQPEGAFSGLESTIAPSITWTWN